jgi:hypothetical protein
VSNRRSGLGGKRAGPSPRPSSRPCLLDVLGLGFSSAASSPRLQLPSNLAVRATDQLQRPAKPGHARPQVIRTLKQQRQLGSRAQPLSPLNHQRGEHAGARAAHQDVTGKPACCMQQRTGGPRRRPAGACHCKPHIRPPGPRGDGARRCACARARRPPLPVAPSAGRRPVGARSARLAPDPAAMSAPHRPPPPQEPGSSCPHPPPRWPSGGSRALPSPRP